MRHGDNAVFALLTCGRCAAVATREQEIGVLREQLLRSRQALTKHQRFSDASESEWVRQRAQIDAEVRLRLPQQVLEHLPASVAHPASLP